MKVEVEPIYGWGWSIGDAFVDTPAGFAIDAVAYTGDEIQGVIAQPGHALDRLNVVLTLRMRLPDGRAYDLRDCVEQGRQPTVVGFVLIRQLQDSSPKDG